MVFTIELTIAKWRVMIGIDLNESRASNNRSNNFDQTITIITRDE